MLIYSAVIILSSFMPCFITSLPQYTEDSDNSTTSKILIESSENEENLPIDNNWHNSTNGIEINHNNNNSPIPYQHQRVNYQGNQYQTEAPVNFALTHKQGNPKTSTDYSKDSNDSPHALDINSPSVTVDEALLLFENFGDKIIKNDSFNYYDNDNEEITGESQSYYISTESPVENNGDKTIRVSSENYKNALASFKSQLIKNSMNNVKGLTSNTRKALPELSRLTFQSFNDSLTEGILEKEVTVNQKFNSQEPIVVSETGVTENYEYGTTFPCNIGTDRSKDFVESEQLSLTTIPPEQPKSSEAYNGAPVHSVNSQLFIRELSNRDQDTASPVVLNPLQAGLALVNADRTHLIGHKIHPQNQFKLNGLSDKEIYRPDNYPSEQNLNDKSIKLPTTQNVTLASISRDNDSDKLVEIQKSLELYHSAPIHEIHYPPQLEIDHQPSTPYNPDLVHPTWDQDSHQLKEEQVSYSDSDLVDSNTDIRFKFLTIEDQNSQNSQPISSNIINTDNNNNNNIIIEQQKIIEINKENFTIKDNIADEDQKSSATEYLDYKKLIDLHKESDNFNVTNNLKNWVKQNYPGVENDKISDGTDNSEQTVYIYSPTGVSDSGDVSIEPVNYNINLPTNSEVVKPSNYLVGVFSGGPYRPYFVSKDNRVVEKLHQKQKLKKHVPVVEAQAYPVTVEKMSKNKVPAHHPTKTITGTSIHKLVSQPYPVHILEQSPYQGDKVIEMPIRIPSYHPLGIPQRLPSSSSIKSEKLNHPSNLDYHQHQHQQITNPSGNGLHPRLQETNSQVQSFPNSSTQNFKGYSLAKQTVMPLVVAMRSPLSKRYSLLSQFGLVKHQQHPHLINYYSSNSKKHFYNNNLVNQFPISMHHPKSPVDHANFQWHVIHPFEKQKGGGKIEYVGPVPSLTPHHVLNLHQNQVPHPAHQESLHYFDASDTSLASSSSSSSSAALASSYFPRVRLPEIHYYGKIGNFRQSKMEYGFKPPMVPSIQYDEETGTKVDH